MTHTFKLVQWNRHKAVYDRTLATLCVCFLLGFIAMSVAIHQPPNDIAIPVLLMRALGTLAIVLLHVILLIGPLHRLDERFAPLLYNRRHLGVTMFSVAFLHGLVALGFYGGFGITDPATAMLTGYGWSGGIRSWPFEIFGVAALVILFLMASTSHDYWLRVLGARVWKWLHMGVYLAYALLIVHVALGAMQSEKSLLYPIMIGAGAITLGSVHVLASAKGPRRLSSITDADDNWVSLGSAEAFMETVPDSRGTAVDLPNGERVAVFRNGDTLCAMRNACVHQGGPLSEGKVIDGCVTCPWHGYQYEAGTGHSPPPYHEKLATYELRIRGGAIELNSEARNVDTPAEPIRLGAQHDD